MEDHSRYVWSDLANQNLKCPMHSANLQAYMWLLSGLIKGKHRKLPVSMTLAIIIPCH